MILVTINKSLSVIAAVLDVIFTILINAIVVPMSLLYTAITDSLSEKWKISEVSGIYYFWWSHRDKVVRCSSRLGVTSILDQLAKFPRTILIIFAILALPLITAAAVRQAFKLFGKADTPDKNGIIDVEVIDAPQSTGSGKGGNKV